MIGEFEDLRQSDGWSDYISRLGWEVEKVGKAKIFIRKLPLVGAVAKIQRPAMIPPLEKIAEVARRNRALFVKLEPGWVVSEESRIKNEGWGRDGWPLLPTLTIQIDLTPSEAEIFEKFSKDARYSIHKAQRVGVEIRSWKLEVGNLETFYNLFKETGERKRFWVPPFRDLQAKAEAFKDKSALILAYHNKEAIAGALVLFHDKVAYYHHAASSPAGRKLLAPYLVVWEAIKVAKKRGCHILDLEGIYDPRYPIYKRFQKIGIFKRKFGGREIEYPGSFVRYYDPNIKLIFGVNSLFS